MVFLDDFIKILCLMCEGTHVRRGKRLGKIIIRVSFTKIPRLLPFDSYLWGCIILLIINHKIVCMQPHNTINYYMLPSVGAPHV